MQHKHVYVTVCALAALLIASPAAAQTTNRFTFNVGAGFTEPVRHSDGRLDHGFNINAGAGYNFHPNFGLIGEFGYNWLGLAESALTAAGVPDGSARIYSLTLNPIVRLNPEGRFDAYLIGGGGYYRRTVELTEPTISTVTAFDPFWGVFFPVAVPTDVVLGSFSQNKAGLNFGGGFTVRVKGDSNTKFFAETRYHHLFTSPVRTNMLPVTFGLRW
jgi:opacity protein-like surface antigen